MTRELPLSVACFGGANIDIKAQALCEPLLETSNPVQTTYSFGGVARNIAENLARLQLSVSLISRVGMDEKGDALFAALKKIRIHDIGVSRSACYPTATYTALLKPQGEMLIAMADMEIYRELTPEVIAPVLSQMQQVPYWIMDANLTEESLAYLVQKVSPHTQLWAVPVSIPKVAKFRSHCPFIYGLVLNEGELAALVKEQIHDIVTLQKACQIVRQRGVKNVIVTRGKQGLYFDGLEGSQLFSVSPLVATDVTGAGDAFTAGVLYGNQKGLGMQESILYGLAMARLTLQTKDSVKQDLSIHQLETEKEKLKNHEILT